MALREFVLKLRKQSGQGEEECLCSACCATVRTSKEAPTLEEAQARHECVGVSLNTFQR